MRAHNLQITGSLNVSGSKGVDFSNATGGVSGSFRPSDVKTALPSSTVSSSTQIASNISGSLGSNASVIRTLNRTTISGSFTSTSSSLATRATTLEAASASLETNKATKGFAIAMSVAL